MANRLQLRRDGAQQWANINPILAQGELGIEIDTSRIKIGDGVTPWNSLRYERPIETESNAANTLVKRDADGNFEAGAISATLIGNASTSTRLASARQIQLTGSITGSGSFDGSSNLNLATNLELVSSLPHYNPNDPDATALYSRVEVDSRGRVVGASLASTLAEYGITDAQGLDSDLTALANMTTFGLLTRTATGQITTRNLTGGAGRLIFTTPDGVASNPFIDLADTAVVVGSYNVESLTSVSTNGANGEPFGTETVNASKFSVDRYGRVTQATNVPIATATEGSKYPTYNASTSYNRYDIIENGSNLYQAIADIAAAQGAPSHSTETVTYAVTVNAETDGNKYYLNGSIYPNLTFKRGSTYIFNQDDASNVLHPLHFSETSNGTHGGGSVYNVGVTYKLDGVVVSYSDYYNNTNFTNATTRQVEIVVSKNAPNLLHYYCYYHSGMSNNAYIDVVNSDVGNWRWLNPVAVEQKGLASFAQEDFDVDANGHVTIASQAVDNTQLQNTRVGFADGNTLETFELDQELTATTGYRGFNYLNYVTVNDTSGNLLFTANNVDNSGAGGVDINVDTHISGALIKLDRPGNTPLQTIERSSGSLKIHHNVNSAVDRTLDIISNNAGAGTSKINVTSDDGIVITATNVNSKVQVEDFYLQQNTIGTNDTTMVLDPGDDDAATGLVQVRGNLQVDGTTTTVNSTTITVDDPIITLGGDTAPTTDDNKDRGVEIRYYDSQARLGFFGWDEDYSNPNIWSGTGGYRFLYNATNTSEVFSGTNAPLIAGNLELTTNTGSTSTTTGTLVVTGGFGLSENANIGGTVTVAGQSEINNNVIIKADNKEFAIQNGSGVDKFTVDTDNGNTIIEGTLDVQLETEITDNLIVTADAKTFKIRTASNVDKFTVDTDNGNTVIEGTLNTKQGVDLDQTLNVDGDVTLNATLDVDDDVTLHNDFLMDTTGKTFTLTNGSTQKFQISTTNGNTDIEGTLNLGNFFHSEDVDVPTIGTNAQDDFIISSGDYGSFRFDGGGYIEGDTLFNSDLYINGAINQKDLGTTETFSTQNYLRVRYKVRAGSTVAYTPSYATDNNSNLRVFGGAGIATDLYIGDDLYIGKLNSGDTTEFTVLGESGNTTIGRVGAGSASAGTLTVHGDVTLNRDVSLNGSQNTIGDSSGDALTVNATSQFTAPVTLSSGQDLNVGGNAIVDGNLTVHGSTTTVNSTTITVDDPIITLGGDTAPSSDDAKDRGVEFRYFDSNAKIGFFGWDDSALRFAVYHNATNSSEVFSGTRSGIDAGSIKLFDTTNASNSSTGALIVGGGAGIGLDLQVGDDLIVGDDGSFGGDVDITGTLDVTNNFRVNTNKFTVASSTGNTLVAGTFRADGVSTLNSSVNIVGGSSNLSVGGTLGVTSNTTLSGTLGVTLGATLSNTLDVSGATNITNTLGVTGVSTITNATNATLGGTWASNGALRVSAGGLSVAGNTGIGGDLKVYTNTTLDGTLGVGGIVSLAEKLRSNSTAQATAANNNGAAIFTAGGLAVTKKAFIGDDLDVGAGNFTVDGPTGNTVVGGTFDVTGGTTTISSLIATSVANLQSTLNVGGSFNINTNKFNVASASGNTDIAGTLDVTNAVDFDSSLNVDGNADFNSGIDVTAGNATFAGLVQANNITDSSAYNDAAASVHTDGGLSVNKKAFIGDDLSVGGAAGVKFTVDGPTGNTDITGTLNVQDGVTLQSTLGVTGQITGNVTGDLTGNADTASLVDVTNTTGSNLTFFPTFVSATTGNTEIRTDSDNFKYIPSSNTLSVSNFVCSTNFEIQGNLNITGTITFQESQVGDISNHDTDALAEGSTNLYFTDERVDDRVAALIAGGTGISATYNDAGNLLTLSADFGEFDTDNIVEGSTNLFTTAARTRTHFTYGTGIELSGAGQLSVTQSDINTDNVTEGSTNLFTTAARTRTHFTYGTGIEHSSGTLSVTQSDINTDNITEGSTNLFTTAARTRGHISVSGDLGYNSSTGVISFTTPTTIASLSNHDTDDLAEGSTNLYYTDARADARVTAGITGKLDASAISTFGLTLVDDASASAARTTLGLGSAATTAASAYATAAQGTLADSATQPGDLGAVATSNNYNDLSNKPTLFSGAYNDLTGKPTLGTAAATASTDYATAAQGAKADSALQAETITLAQLKTAAANSINYTQFAAAIAAL